MEKLKKHQKLEKAMRDYPHGTRLLSEPTNEEIVSTGVFWVHENGNVLCQVDQMNSFSIYVDLFDKWAEFIHERVVLPVLKTEDGFDRYEGDECHWVLIMTGTPSYMYELSVGKRHADLDFESTYKVFSTKEAAEKWIKEQNKPKEIIISINDQFPTKVVYGGAEISTEHGKLFVTGREIEEIYDAFKSLQS